MSRSSIISDKKKTNVRELPPLPTEVPVPAENPLPNSNVEESERSAMVYQTVTRARIFKYLTYLSLILIVLGLLLSHELQALYLKLEIIEVIDRLIQESPTDIVHSPDHALEPARKSQEFLYQSGIKLINYLKK